ncbi:protein-tyrosine phosphatase-like protein [Mortierella sp. GBAus27b]|nr:dual specificity phosphatase 12 [Mortierella sp. GBA43]KAI8361263.1 protein-tyrosine phosphatase-like protein [Mortierella sp. GBAus27b]
MSGEPLPSVREDIFKTMQEIVPGLYLGGASPAQNRELLARKGVTHILRVTDAFVWEYTDDFTYKVIAVPDLDETNLLKFFPDTFEYINDAITRGGKVLVHCSAGVSRSVTIVCAYLMKTQNMTAETALDHVQSIRFVAEPNDGFVKQLVLYNNIGLEVDPSNAEYRQFLMTVLADERRLYGKVDDAHLATDPDAPQSSKNARERPPVALTSTASVQDEEALVAGAIAAVANAAASSSSSSSSTSGLTPPPPPTQPLPAPPPLKCKKCRRILVERENILVHIPGRGQNAFDYRKRDGSLNSTQAVQSNKPGAQSTSSACHSYFIEPIQWIKGLEDLEGKISCPKCDSKLGTFNWSGDQCSCGYWVTPAFMIHKSKIDG